MLSESNWKEEKGGFVYVHVREKESGVKASKRKKAREEVAE